MEVVTPGSLALVASLAACGRGAPAPHPIETGPCRIADGFESWLFTYDDRGRLTQRLDQRSDNDPFSRTCSFTYERDRLTHFTCVGLAYETHYALGYDAAGHHTSTSIGGRLDWTGRYEESRLIEAVELEPTSMPGIRHTFEHDARGRIVRDTSINPELVRLSRSRDAKAAGTTVVEYAYDDSSPCKLDPQPEPLLLPGRPPPPACPVLIRTIEGDRVSERRLLYRSGRLVDDGFWTYTRDSTGRVRRVQSLRHPEVARLYEYECGL